MCPDFITNSRMDPIFDFCWEHGLAWRYEYYYSLNTMHLVIVNPKTHKHWGIILSPEDLAYCTPTTRPAYCGTFANDIINRIPKDLYSK